MEVDAGALKLKGFFQQAQGDQFSLRLCMSGGTIDTETLKKAVEIAEKYGDSQIHFTVRQQIEIPFISDVHVEAVQKEIATTGISTFIGGARCRTVVACLGSTVCKFGQIETGGLAKEIHKKYFGRELPAKIKIAITGCKNNCAKVEANDIGIRGVNHGYLMYFGGCFGHETRIGKTILPVLNEKDDVLKVLEAAINFFEANANKGERLGKLIERIGIEKLKEALETVLKPSGSFV
jgi:dissimilatory sulfite reductase (desulfoviridin) alpha/beta subunit